MSQNDSAEPASASEPETASDVAPDAPVAEGKQDIIGIMATHSTWVVPQWIKVITFVVSVVGIGGVAYAQIEKRATFRNLLVDSTVQPESWGDRVAPSFNLPNGPAGESVDLSAMKGSWVLLNFWATWCPPCRDEMPSLEMLTRRLARDHAQNMKVVTITVDEDWNEVNRFFGATPPSFTVAWDREKSVAGRYGSSRFPETYLIDPNGKVAAKFVGPRDWYNQGMVQYFSEVLSGLRKPLS